MVMLMMIVVLMLQGRLLVEVVLRQLLVRRGQSHGRPNQAPLVSGVQVLLVVARGEGARQGGASNLVCLHYRFSLLLGLGFVTICSSKYPKYRLNKNIVQIYSQQAGAIALADKLRLIDD